MVAATFTWTNKSAAGAWNAGTNWSAGTVPGAGDTAVLPPQSITSGGNAYIVQVTAFETVGTLDMIGSHNRHIASPYLAISGTVDATALDFGGATPSNPTAISIRQGGLLDVGTISDPGALAEHIDIVGQPSSTTTDQASATLRLGSFEGGNSDTTFNFVNNGSAANYGVINFGSVTVGAVIDQPIQNFNWGDEVIVGTQGNFTGATVTLVADTLEVTSGATLDWAISGVSSTATLFSMVNGDTVVALCFARGSGIATPAGERPVETLRAGDSVSVLDGASLATRSVKWIGRRRIVLAAYERPELVAPVRIRRGAFDENVPHADLVLSPDHAVFLDGKLIAVRQLVNGASIVQDTTREAVEYYHVELDRHAILLAHGLPAESYLDTGNRGFFANADAPLLLHPDLMAPQPARVAGACAPFLVDEASVRPLWERLAARARTLGMVPAEPATTDDPDLRLLAHGRTIAPSFTRNGLYVFHLPEGASGARIVSRAAAPAALRPWLDDRRELGVAVRRIVLRAAETEIDIPLDGPLLGDGWWEPERDGAGRIHRWSNGRALLSLPRFNGHAMLELHVQATMDYPVARSVSSARRSEAA